ncbi:MAG: peptidylprolyl isomerase [Gemmatimonadales bacterium]
MLRKTVLAASLMVALSACGAGGLGSGPDVAATAAGQQLPTQRVADILATAKGAKLTPESAEFIANLWVDYTLFAQAVANGNFTGDSAMIVKSTWPALAQIRADRWHDSLIARRAKATDAQVDSTYNAGADRAIQHILIGVPPTATKPERAAAQKKINDIAAQLKSGGNFGALAVKNSMDGSAGDSGYMPIGPKGRFVPAFDSVAYGLPAGATSAVVPTQFGFHIIRRPPLAESRKRYSDFVKNSQIAFVDSAYFAELDKENDFKLDPSATAKIKTALADIDGKRNDNTKLVAYKGGGFTVADLLKWVGALTADPVKGPQTLQQIKAAPDSQLTEFVRRLAQNALVLQDAEKNGVQILPAEWKTISSEFAMQVDTLKVSMGITPEVLDPKASSSERSKAAALKVDQYFDKLIKGETRLRVLPGLLASALRSEGKYKVNEPGIKRALEIAAAKKGPDSTAVPPAMIQPAPAGAPVPGGDAQPVAPAPAPKKP